MTKALKKAKKSKNSCIYNCRNSVRLCNFFQRRRGTAGIFLLLLFCADCGGKLYFATSSGSIGLCFGWQACPLHTAFYVISVRLSGPFPATVFLPMASGFLRIPPHGGHPFLRLTLPATKCVVDFHHRVIAHAGRTQSSPTSNMMCRMWGCFCSQIKSI